MWRIMEEIGRYVLCMFTVITTASAQVYTAGGNGPDGKTCQLPFMFSGQEYGTCICDGKPGTPWCSLTDSYDQDSQYALCIGVARCPEPGETTHECSPNFQGDLCDSCVENSYGIYCNLTCACAGGRCDRLIGSCEDCGDGFYGENCDRQCGHCVDNRCDRQTGNCNCLEGFYGDDCTNPTTRTSEKPTTDERAQVTAVNMEVENQQTSSPSVSTTSTESIEIVSEYQSENHKLYVAKIAVPVAFGVGIIIILVIVICFWMHYKRVKKGESDDEIESKKSSNVVLSETVVESRSHALGRHSAYRGSVAPGEEKGLAVLEMDQYQAADVALKDKTVDRVSVYPGSQGNEFYDMPSENLIF